MRKLPIFLKEYGVDFKKWEHPWISLTGGIDSNTTFAAANGMYDRFEAFSYISAEKEIRDAEAAAKIAKAFGVKHHIYNIPDNSNEISDYDLKVEIQRHNSGYIAERKPNESRKRFYLEENCGCDVEVKSWVSETIRGYWYKHFDRKNFRSCPRSFIEISIRYLYLTGSLHTRLTRFCKVYKRI